MIDGVEGSLEKTGGKSIKTVKDLFAFVSGPTKRAVEKLYLKETSEDIFISIYKLVDGGKYNEAIDFIEGELKFSYSNETISDLCFILGETYFKVGEIQESLEAFKKSRSLDKSNYIDSTVEILQNYLLLSSFGKLKGNIEILLNEEFVNAQDLLSKEDFALLEIDFIEIFNLLGLKDDASEILKEKMNYSKLLYFIEYQRAILNKSKQYMNDIQRLTKMQEIVYLYESVSNESELLDESYEKFVVDCEDGKIWDFSYEDRNFEMFGKLADDFCQKIYDLALKYFKETKNEEALKLLGILIKYSHNSLNYENYIKGVKLFSEIINKNPYNHRFVNIFKESDFLFLKSSDYYLLGNIYYGLGNFIKALSVYETYYSIGFKKEEVREKTKNFLEILISNEDLMNFSIKKESLKNQYYTEIDERKSQILVYQTPISYDFSRNFAYILTNIYEKVSNGERIKR